MGAFQRTFMPARSVANMPLGSPFMFEAMNQIKIQEGKREDLAPKDLTSSQLHERYQLH